jgi:hypothetical protein
VKDIRRKLQPCHREAQWVAEEMEADETGCTVDSPAAKIRDWELVTGVPKV